MQDLGDNRHFYMLQKIIVLGYSCKSHGQLYTHFDGGKKSLYCPRCVNEMRNVPNLFHFQSKQEILSKLLNSFNIKFCRNHNSEITDFCVSHIQYYCKRCWETCTYENSFKLDKTIIDREAGTNNNSETLLRNRKVQMFDTRKRELELDYDDGNYSEYEEDYEEEDLEDDSAMFVSLWNKNNNNIQNKKPDQNIEEIIKSTTNPFVKYSGNNQNNLPTTQNAIRKKENNNNNITVVEVKPETIIVPKENSYFCYPFLNNGKLILYDSEKKNYKKLKFTDKYLGKKECEIIKYIGPNTHREFTYIKHENIISKYDHQKQVIFEVLKFDEELEMTFRTISGITNDSRLVGFDLYLKITFMDLNSKTVKIIEDNDINNYQESCDCYWANQKGLIYQFRNRLGDGSLLIYLYLWGVKKNSITFFINNQNYDAFQEKYFNERLMHYEFKDQSETKVINASFENKIQSLCKNSFFYELDSKLYLCFILNRESYQFVIDLDNQSLKLDKHTHYENQSIGFSVEKKDQDETNIQSGENIYYLNIDNALIEFNLRDAVFSQKFEFI